MRRLLASPPAAPLHVRAVVHRVEVGWVVELTLEGAARGTRTLRAGTCESVGRAAALIVALALDPQAAARVSDEIEHAEAPAPLPSPAPVRPPEPTRRPAPGRPPTPDRPPLVQKSRREGVRGQAFVLLAAEHGYVPGVVPALQLGGGLYGRFWRADLVLQSAPFARGTLDEAPRAGASFATLSAEARGCAGPAWNWLRIDGCAGVRGTRIGSHGTGVTESYRAHAEVLAATLGVRVRVPSRTRVAAEAGLGADLPVTRPDFVLLEGERERSVHRVQPVALRAAVGVSVRF